MNILFKSGIFILLLDLLIILLHLFLGRYFNFFHLDFEHNIPTTYQFLKLLGIFILTALFIYSNYFLKKFSRKEIMTWVPFGLGFLFLGIDELGQLHENIHEFLHPIAPQIIDFLTAPFAYIGLYSYGFILYIPLFIAFGIYMLYFIKYLLSKKDKSLFLLVIGSILFFLVPVVEFINTADGVSFEEYQILIAVEESLEIIGGSLFFIFIYRYFINIFKEVKKARNYFQIKE